MASTSTLFPPPPPTTNALSSKQRAHLIRSTHKLGRVLGTTPRLLEPGSSLVYDTTLPKRLRLRRSRTPYEIKHADSQAYYLTDLIDTYTRPRHAPLRRVFATSRSSTLRQSFTTYGDDSCDSISSSESPRASSSSIPRPSLDDYHRRSRSSVELCRPRTNVEHPPLLMLAPTTPRYPPMAVWTGPSVKPMVEIIPAQPLGSDSPPDSPLEPDVVEKADEDTDTPAFIIRSENSIRRAKMERVRRKLGECIPVELVFPDEEEDWIPEPVLLPVATLGRSKLAPIEEQSSESELTDDGEEGRATDRCAAGDMRELRLRHMLRSLRI